MYDAIAHHTRLHLSTLLVTCTYLSSLVSDQEFIADIPVLSNAAVRQGTYPQGGLRKNLLQVLEPQGRSVEELAVYRWLEFGCFPINESSPMLVLYWQVLFSQLFYRVEPLGQSVYQIIGDLYPRYIKI
jgi:hypothetical protein